MHLPPWLTKPEVIFGTLLTVVLFLASLYQPEIRRGLRWPGRKMSRTAVRSLLNFYQTDLVTLEHIHDNAYNLVLWLAWAVLSFLNWLFWALIVSAAVGVVVYLATKDRWYISTAAFIGPAIGACVGRTRRYYRIIMALFNYDECTATLRKNIEECKAVLEASEVRK